MVYLRAVTSSYKWPLPRSLIKTYLTKNVKLFYTWGFSSCGTWYRIDTRRFEATLVTEVRRLAHALLQTTGYYMWQWGKDRQGLLLINRTPYVILLIVYFKSSTKLARVFQTVSPAKPGPLLISAFPETKLQDRGTSTLSSDWAWVHMNLQICFECR